MNFIKSRLFFFIAGVFSVILLIVSVYLISGLFVGENTYSITNALKSPDGKHIAISCVGMGGGAAGWCNQYIIVDTKDISGSIIKGKIGYENVIFEASCGSDISFEWVDSKRLRIFYTWPGDDIRIDKKKYSEDRLVALEFIESKAID
jgi:hypothetical protein